MAAGATDKLHLQGQHTGQAGQYQVPGRTEDSSWVTLNKHPSGFGLYWLRSGVRHRQTRTPPLPPPVPQTYRTACRPPPATRCAAPPPSGRHSGQSAPFLRRLPPASACPPPPPHHPLGHFGHAWHGWLDKNEGVGRLASCLCTDKALAFKFWRDRPPHTPHTLMQATPMAFWLGSQLLGALPLAVVWSTSPPPPHHLHPTAHTLPPAPCPYHTTTSPPPPPPTPTPPPHHPTTSTRRTTGAHTRMLLPPAGRHAHHRLTRAAR